MCGMTGEYWSGILPPFSRKMVQLNGVVTLKAMAHVFV